MAKVQQKSEKITAFGGIFFVLDRFDRILSSVIDSHLGLRSKSVREGEAADRLDYGGDRIPAVRRAVVPLREFRGRKALPPRRAAAAQAEGRAT